MAHRVSSRPDSSPTTPAQPPHLSSSSPSSFSQSSLSSVSNPKKSSWGTRFLAYIWAWVCNGFHFFFGKKETTPQPPETTVPKKRPIGTLFKAVRSANAVFSQNGFYITPLTQKKMPLCSRKALVEKSKYYKCRSEGELNLPKKQLTKIRVVEGDCLDVAQHYAAAKVLILSLASTEFPGGGYVLDEAGGQEEQICYRSELGEFMALLNEKQLEINNPTMDPNEELNPLATYNLAKHDRLLLTNDVTVFRANKAQNYVIIEEPFKVGVLSCAAPHLRDNELVQQADGSIDYANIETKATVRNLIFNQLLAAYEAGYSTLILGAFGCGAFKNPPGVVSQLYQEVINTHFKNVFKTIVFAILNDPYPQRHNPRGNIQPFKNRFPD